MALKTGKILEKTLLTHDVIELAFEISEEIEFVPGQFISIRVEDRMPPCIRAYSVADFDATTKIMKLCIKIVKDGRGSNWLDQLKVGDQINFIGPNGNFVYQEADKDIVFVATGTGVAPFYSIIKELLAQGFKKDIKLIFGVRFAEDLFYIKDFESWAKDHKNFSLIHSVSRPDEFWSGKRGRVTQIIEEEFTAGTIKKEDQYYICGLNAMIASVEEVLIANGVDKSDIHFERYD
jgi:ferredoxin-NADP reductase